MQRGSAPIDRPPRFCPRCRGGAGPEGTLCEHCGETLAEEGFCPVCEHHWPRAVGEECPKHEIPLEPSSGIFEALPVAGIDWVTVRSFPHTMAAGAARLRLEAEGIPTFLAGERMGLNALYQVATGGVKLQVPREVEADARVLLAQSWAIPEADDELDDIDPPPAADVETLVPELPTTPERPGWQREIVVGLVLLALAFLIAWLFATGR